jgi:Zn-dependent peptidase ImmA (M78 family)
MAGPATKGARTKAHRVRTEHGLGLDGPVPDLLRLADRLGVNVVVPERLPRDLAGVYLPREPRPVILLNGADIAPRLRFTLAHELAHHVFHDDRQEDTHAGLVKNGHWIEVRANAFAAELLMPAPAMAAFATQGAPGIDRVIAVANTFGTSLLASAIRLATAGLIDGPACDALKAEIEADEGLLYARLAYRDSIDLVKLALPWSSVDNSRLAKLGRVAATAEQVV